MEHNYDTLKSFLSSYVNIYLTYHKPLRALGYNRPLRPIIKLIACPEYKPPRILFTSQK